jgi:hypothetical protein
VFLFEQLLELPLFLKVNLFHCIKNIALANLVIIPPINPTIRRRRIPKNNYLEVVIHIGGYRPNGCVRGCRRSCRIHSNNFGFSPGPIDLWGMRRPWNDTRHS